MHAVLLLNVDHTPMKIVPWQKAMCLLLADKVRLIESYGDKVVHSASGKTWPWPAVVALKTYERIKRAESKVKFKRLNVLARDGFACAYCGVKPQTSAGLPDLSRLSVDHVVPKSRAVDGKVKLPWNGRVVPMTCWDNVVSSCNACNYAKADRTPAEAGMKLQVVPRRPNPFDVVRIVLSRMAVPAEWEPHLSS